MQAMVMLVPTASDVPWDREGYPLGNSQVCFKLAPLEMTFVTRCNVPRARTVSCGEVVAPGRTRGAFWSKRSHETHSLAR